MTFIDVVKESAIDPGFVHEAFALVIGLNCLKYRARR